MQYGGLQRKTLIAVLALGMANPALADGGDLIGGLVGAMIGAAIVNGANQQQRNQAPRTTTRVARPSLSTADRQRNAEVQTALNHFGFPVGNPDGVLGSRSRAAIGQYQALLSFAPTGALAELERQILVTAYQRALMGGPEVTKIVSTSPMGLRGVLLAQRDLMLGTGAAPTVAAGYGGLPPEIAEALDEVARNSGIEGPVLIERAGFLQLADMNGDGRSDYLMDTAVTGSGFWCTGPACAVRVFLSTPSGYKRNDFLLADPVPAAFACSGDVCRLDDAPVMAVAPQPDPAPQAAAPQTDTVMVGAKDAAPVATLPSFAAALAPAGGYSAHCKAVAEGTAKRGGIQTVVALDDPAQALGEQFCAVSAEAQAAGTALMAQVQGFTPDQIAQQCKGFAAALLQQIAVAAGNPRDTALSEVQAWLAKAGMPQEQLVGTAQICLSVGYASDDAAMALGSALVLAGTGNMIYGEFVGHHLASGLGIARSADLALEWFDGAGEAVKAGQQPVFLPAQADRMGLVLRAAGMAAGKAGTPPLLPIVPVSAP